MIQGWYCEEKLDVSHSWGSWGGRIDDTVGDNKNYKRVAITKKLLSMLKKDSLLLCICLVIDHRWCQKVTWGQKSSLSGAA